MSVATDRGTSFASGSHELQNSYDTRQLLAMVEGMDRLMGGWKRAVPGAVTPRSDA
jgi:hypothetical protein